MNGPAHGNRWVTLGSLFGVLGMLGAFFVWWMSFDSRLARVETEVQRLDRMENKLDRLIER